MAVHEDKSRGAGSSVWGTAATKTYGGVWYIAERWMLVAVYGGSLYTDEPREVIHEVVDMRHGI